ncbi:TetR/AcrR family transcriptional regulator [Leifsonia sp. YAF41]|uniref:TetR/AcrR family transcriptional regulator n=1 Tax=Leifsonia sp. YAF41 TaxID=3233086 RepID=UPI003F9B0F06
MPEPTDPRAIRSRAALLAIAEQLLGEARADELTITEVASRAGVSRPTFYQHFADVPALIAAAVVADLEASFARSDAQLTDQAGVEFLRGTIRMLLEHVSLRREVYRRVLRGSSSYVVLSAAVGYISTRMSEHVLGAHLAPGSRADDDRITSIAAGSTWLVLQWLETDFPGRDTPEAFAEHLSDLMLTLAGVPDTLRS